MRLAWQLSMCQVPGALPRRAAAALRGGGCAASQPVLAAPARALQPGRALLHTGAASTSHLLYLL